MGNKKNKISSNIPRGDHEYWYYFGKCIPYPHKIKKGMSPMTPYKRFKTKKECQAYIDAGKTFDPMTELLKHGR